MSESLLPVNGGSRKSHGLTTPLVCAVAVACMGTVQFGYHIAELNAPQRVMSCSEFELPSEEYTYGDTWVGRHGLEECVPLDNQQFGLVTSVFSIGGLVGSYYASRLADKWGRKYASFGTCILNIVGSLILFTANSYASLIVGRILVGVACGVGLVVTPVYINEITPTPLKGAMGAMNQVSINLGILLTQTLSLKFANSFQWRWILFTGAIIAAINFVLWAVIWESPKWLTKMGRTNHAEIALFHIRNGTYKDCKQEIQAWEQEFETATPVDSTSRGPLLWKYIRNPLNEKPRHAITMILSFQQFCGINSIIFYGVKVISQLIPDYAIQINFAICALNVLVTLFASAVIDRWGRRPLLMVSTIVMAASSFAISIGIIQMISVLLVISVFVYVTAFAMGLGPIPLLIIGELSSPEDSATAQSYGTVCNWLATFIVAYTFPLAHDLLGGYVYMIFAINAIIITSFVKKNVPETKGKDNYDDIWSGY